jgi:hypothetical protein
MKSAQKLAQQRYAVYQQLAGITVPRIESEQVKAEALDEARGR